MKNTCERLLDEIGNYIRRLTVDYHLEICICDFKLPAAYHRILTTFGGHVNEYCRQTKTAPRGYNRCLWMQKFVREKCKKDEPFFGTCYAGVSEFVFPIVENGHYYGFISVSGYRLANRNDASYQTLNPTPPPLTDIQALIAPLINSFKLLSHHLADKHKESVSSRQVRVYGEILRFLSEKYLQKIALKDVADELHYSASYLEHVFRKENGMPLMKYLRLLKLEKAKELLLTTDKSVLDIAETVGFEDSNYFTAVFTNVFGLSPRVFRKSNE